MENARSSKQKERPGCSGKRPRFSVPSDDSYDADTDTERNCVPFRKKNDSASSNALRPLNVNDSYVLPKDEGKIRFISRLIKWATSHNIEVDAMDSLLKILRRHGCDFLPSSSAALKLAARRIAQIEYGLDVVDTSDEKLQQSVDESLGAMKQSIHELRTDVKSDLTRMEVLLTQILGSVDKSQLANVNSDTSVTLMEDIIPEPMRDVDELARFVAEKLNSNAKKFEMADAMKALGGLNVNESVRRMYHRIATDEVWSQYCVKGRNDQKRAVCKLSLYNIVYRACCYVHKNVSVRDYEDAVRSVLRHAPGKLKAQQTKVENVGEGLSLSRPFDMELDDA